MAKEQKNKIKTLIGFIQKGKGNKVKESLEAILLSKVQKKLNKKEKELSKTLFKESLDKTDVLWALEDISKNHMSKVIKFQNGETTKVDAFTAMAMMEVYKAIKQSDARAKFGRMVNKDLVSFLKVVDFCWTKVK